MIVVFDLDDTLYKEIDFLKSAYQEISDIISEEVKDTSKVIYKHMLKCYESGGNAFQSVLEVYCIQNFNVRDLVHMYQNHYPNITLSDDTIDVLAVIKKKAFKVGLITDGRSKQQRNKILALKLSDFFDDVIISEEFGSEKPNIKNYKYFENKYGVGTYIYIGDNIQKDFISPNKLGWISVCLQDDGNNIHKQIFSKDNNAMPQHVITKIIDFKRLVIK